MTERKITPELIQSKIRSVHYINAGRAVLAALAPDASLDLRTMGELSLVTVCIIELENGFKVEGTSACVDPSNYNEEIGQKCAFDNAFEKIWPLEGYLLKETLYQERETRDLLADLNDDDCDGCKI
ncbi:MULTISPECIES: Gp49 family protein [Pantoea]|jgi:hypothetical protein|uniref:Phage protein n=1 Tax=Pantoea brenneri TaxID=472694 RepID=A0A7Y6NH69_9GAMM|nr:MULTISPECIES: Gp49 family protein [Pantoea]MBZ6397042.1 hypothetical protein [Pantoea sp.]MBZ6440207.1 hypothetical protein [Pantoea sp.]NUY43431.1 hypothetical protein [Pantoea brenneri]NUY51003.1 hypothetical protein [Pantoea brenneri]NUY61266.1 hypothetical protein [Pantoea brenneri]